MSKRFIASLSVAAIALAAGSAYSQTQFGTAAEARAMEEKAVAEMKANEAAAIEKFNSGTGGFRDRDLYVFCYNMTSGAFTAHVNKALIGTDVRALKEKAGLAARPEDLRPDQGLARGDDHHGCLQFPEARN